MADDEIVKNARARDAARSRALKVLIEAADLQRRPFHPQDGPSQGDLLETTVRLIVDLYHLLDAIGLGRPGSHEDVVVAANTIAYDENWPHTFSSREEADANKAARQVEYQNWRIHRALRF